MALIYLLCKTNIILFFCPRIYALGTFKIRFIAAGTISISLVDAGIISPLYDRVFIIVR